jgi:hypothetical protein
MGRVLSTLCTNAEDVWSLKGTRESLADCKYGVIFHSAGFQSLLRNRISTYFLPPCPHRGLGHFLAFLRSVSSTNLVNNTCVLLAPLQPIFHVLNCTFREKWRRQAAVALSRTCAFRWPDLGPLQKAGEPNFSPPQF